MAYATVEELEARWRSLSEDERSRAGVMLDDAAVRIDAACPMADPESPTEHELAVRLIVSCDMVKRALAASAGAGGVSQLGQTAGPFSQQLTFANPAGDMYMTKADKKLLGCGGQQAWSVSLISGELS